MELSYIEVFSSRYFIYLLCVNQVMKIVTQTQSSLRNCNLYNLIIMFYFNLNVRSAKLLIQYKVQRFYQLCILWPLAHFVQFIVIKIFLPKSWVETFSKYKYCMTYKYNGRQIWTCELTLELGVLKDQLAIMVNIITKKICDTSSMHHLFFNLC